jgi:regulator of protease activity HflC (stomatin/prohibitin superfamily)
MGGFFERILDLLRMLKWWVVLSPWEEAVRVRLGKHTKNLYAGWHWLIPLIDEVHVINTRLRITSVPCQTLTTKDGKVVTASCMIGFKIVDPMKSMMALQAPADSCSAFAMTALSKYIVDRNLTDINLIELEAEVCAALADAAAGIEFEFVNIIDYAVVKTIRLMNESWRPSALPSEYNDKPGTFNY